MNFPEKNNWMKNKRKGKELGEGLGSPFLL
jgi:hypothetical protein